MLRYIPTLVLLALSLTIAPTSAVHANEHAGLAPYLTDDVAGVAFIELQRVNIPAFVAEALRFGAIPEAEAANAQQRAAAMQEVYGKLEKLGARRAYAVLRTSDVAEQGVTWIVEIERDGNAAETAKLLNEWRRELSPRDERSLTHALQTFFVPGEFTVVGETVVAAGSSQQVKRVRELHAKAASGARGDVMAALKGLGEADAGLAIVGDADSRRVLREMFPQMPEPFAAINGKLLADDVRWAGFTVKFPPKFQWSLVADGATPEAAGALEQTAKSGLALASGILLKESVDGAPAHRARAKTLLPLLALVQPRMAGTRLSIGFGDDEQQMAFMRDFLPAMTQNWRDTGYRERRMNRFKQIALAMLNYESAQKSYPPHASYDAEGRPLLSWRVHVLPYLEQSQLYQQFHLDEPWDSEHNRKLIDQMPEVFSDPDPSVRAAIGDQGRTTYVVPVGEGLLFGSKEGKPIKEVIDGTSNTILALEVVPERAVVWTKPADWEVDLTNAMAGLKREDRDGFVAGWCDGHASYMSNANDPALIKKVLTPAGGEDYEVGEFK